jgi:ATP-binding cassette, subfamily B, multidrug efflux pump
MTTEIQIQKNKFFFTLVRIFSLLKSEWKYVLLGIFLMSLASLATVASPRIIAYFIDNVLSTKQSQDVLIVLLFYGLNEILRLSSTAGHMYFFSVAGQRVMLTLRIKLYERMLQLPQSYFSNNPSGQIITRITTDIAAVGQVFTAGVVLIIEKCITVFLICLALLTLNTKLALLALVPYSIFLLASVFISQWVHRVYKNLYAQLERFNSYLGEIVGGIRVIHLFNAEDYHLDDFSNVNQDLAVSQRNARLSFAVLHPLITVITGSSTVLVLWYGAQMISAGEIGLGTLVASLSYVLWLMWPLIHIIEKWSVFLSGMSAAERIFECFAWDKDEELIHLDKSAESIQNINGKISFKDVHFSYDSGVSAIRGLSLSIKAGQKIGIIGPSGSGKSTLFSLLRRFYDPQSGEIRIDGVDISKLDKRSLRASLGLVQQDIFLFGGTVGENISFWEKDIHLRGEIIKEFLPEGLDAEKVIAERGVNLSVGEKQLISFLRCLVSKPQIWLLDEASANLDQNSERRMFEMLKKYAKDETVISIAHRLSTVKDADLIVVMHKGYMIEQGNHEDLMRLGGFYASMFKLQESAV